MLRLTILRAAVMAALLAAWLPLLLRSPEHLLYPASKLAGMLFSRGFPIGPDEQGMMQWAWGLGPVAFMINTLSCLPLTLAVAYVFRRSAFLMRFWDSAVLAAGAISLPVGAYSGLLIVAGGLRSEYPAELLAHHYLFFVDVPLLVSGLVSVVTSYRLMRAGP
jgi:hypothetical protein